MFDHDLDAARVRANRQPPTGFINVSTATL